MKFICRRIPELCSVFRYLNLFSRRFHQKKKSVSHTFFAKLFNVDFTTSKEILRQYPLFRQQDPRNIKHCASILQKAGFTPAYVRNHLRLLSLPPLFLKSSLFLCQEYACYNNKIGPAIIDFSHFVNLRIGTLREHNIIPQHVDVFDSFRYYLKIPKSECDLEIDDYETMKQIYWKFYFFYLKRELKTDDENLRKVQLKDFFHSFRLLRDNLHILRKTFGFTTEDLLKMPYLLRTDPENTITMLRSACGVNLKEIIVSHPRLLTVPSEDIQIVNQFLRENGIDFAVLLNDPDILRMDVNMLMYRLAKLVCSPALSAFKDHPRLPDLVKQGGIISERMLILKLMNMRCYSVKLLTCPPVLFMQHLVEGVDKGSLRDITVIVGNRLRRSQEEVMKQLSKNSGANFIPLWRVKNNLDYLFELGFNADDIFESVQILLYPRKTLQTKLDEILINSIVVNDSIQLQILNKKYFLPFALYYLEKEFNFTAAGVWSEIETVTSDTGSASNGKLIAVV